MPPVTVAVRDDYRNLTSIDMAKPPNTWHQHGGHKIDAYADSQG